MQRRRHKKMPRVNSPRGISATPIQDFRNFINFGSLCKLFEQRRNFFRVLCHFNMRRFERFDFI